MSTMALKIKASASITPANKPDPKRMFGCFGCFAIFPATESGDLTDTGGTPNKCPRCGQDSVLDSTVVPSLDQRLLTEVNGYWFAKK